MNLPINNAKLQRAKAKLIRLTRQAIQEASPSEVLEIWKLVKTQEIRREAPNLEDKQLNAMLTMLAKESGADIVEAAISSETTSSSSQPTLPEKEPEFASTLNRKAK